MPELPEVETMVRDLSSHVVGRRIIGIDAAFRGSVVYPDFEQFEHRVIGASIEDVSRRGKWAIFTLDSGDILAVHRGMTGSLLLRPQGASGDAYTRIAVALDDGHELRFTDPRKFGKVMVMAADGRERPFPWARMGPEPLSPDFDVNALGRRLQGRTAPIKPLLLNQQIVAGLGNIYVDEALFLAGIHPQRRANTLTPEEIERLHGAIRSVLGTAVARRGTSFSSYVDLEGRRGGYQDALQVFQKTDQPCVRCGTPIVRIVVGGRGTHFCPTCQKA